MKAVILAGGFGSRISEESSTKPKPMITVGGKPIIWHIMKMYSHHGVNDFVICCGYKGYMIKEYFANYFLHMSDVTYDVQNNSMHVHQKRAEPWKITLVDTGENTMTGGRLGRIAEYIKDEESFCMTYGDGVSDVDITSTINFHKQHGKLATITGVIPIGRFGELDIRNQQVVSFKEKPKGSAVVNGGFFVLSPKVLSLIKGDKTIWEQEPLIQLAQEGQLMAFEHKGFWQPMDTQRDHHFLEELWNSGDAPWKNWSK
jgi:glucose-1-phosphate cytidylyltransferase